MVELWPEAVIQAGTLAAVFSFLTPGNLLAEECAHADSNNLLIVNRETERANIKFAGVMVLIPGGDICMGDTEGNGEPDEQPVHAVRIENFWLASHEVTREKFRIFVADTGYVSDAERDDLEPTGCLAVDPDKWTFKYGTGFYWDMPGFNQDDTHPVVCVSYDDALAFIGWLNQETGLLFRLPTEAEWEYVARAGTRTTYPWGDSAIDSCKYGNVADRNVWQGYSKSPFGRINCDDGHAFTAPVGRYDANPHGIFDMSGNVWEWTSDCWGKNYSLENVSEICGLRTFRGSSWMNSEKSLRSANRSKNGPSDRLNTVGFRLALDDDGPAVDGDAAVYEGTSLEE
jgi:formylglycine-generating enzyme required for sulfatase activity